MLGAVGEMDFSGVVAVGRVFRALGLALSFGGGLAVLFATRAIFAALPDRAQAGFVSGGVLRRFRALQGCALALVALGALLGARGLPALFGALAAACFLAGLPVDLAVRGLRERIGGSTAGLAPEDPRRKRWGRLHAAAVLLLLAQVILGAAGLVAAR